MNMATIQRLNSAVRPKNPSPAATARQERQPEGLAHARAVSRTEIVAQKSGWADCPMAL